MFELDCKGLSCPLPVIETKKAINCIDYDDILLECRKMFSSYPYILKTLQDKFDYILVDELDKKFKKDYLTKNFNNLISS